MRKKQKRKRRGYTAAELAEVWDRWQRGESSKQIARVLGRGASVYSLLLAHWLLAVVGTSAVEFLGTRFERLEVVTLTPVTAAMTGALALVATIILGLFGAAGSRRNRLTDVLRERSGGGRSRQVARMRSLLTAAEPALAVLLLSAAALVARSLLKLAAVDPGFRPENVISMVLSVAGSSYGTSAGTVHLSYNRTVA